MKINFLLGSALAMAALYGAEAQALPVGWTCNGNCGTAGPNGVVTAPPNGTTYDYISTSEAPAFKGLGLDSETNGSLLTSSQFAAQTGDNLQFYFNYITSDGSGFSDYAYARLLNVASNEYTYLLTARTRELGSVVPGFELPDIDATLTPPNVPIITGGPEWAQLGASSGSCFSEGCGYTGWVSSSYTIKNAGNYQVEFGVVNVGDDSYDTGLALSRVELKSGPVDVPEPASMLLIAGGIAGMIGVRRRVGNA